MSGKQTDRIEMRPWFRGYATGYREGAAFVTGQYATLSKSVASRKVAASLRRRFLTDSSPAELLAIEVSEMAVEIAAMNETEAIAAVEALREAYSRSKTSG